MTKEVKMRKYVFNREAFLNLKTPQEKIEYLRGADLGYTNLFFAYLIYADLSGADLRHAYLSDANLSYADLSGADLNYADLRGADLRHADLPKHKNVTISGYRILIFAFHMQVGCYIFTHEEFLRENSEELTKWSDSDKRLFRKHKEEIKNLLQEFLKNN